MTIAHCPSMLHLIRKRSAWSLWLCTLVARADFQGSTHLTPFDEDTIAYSKTKSDGPVARLQERLDHGQAELVRIDFRGASSSRAYR